MEEFPSLDPTSDPADPVDDCELCLRGSIGRLFDVVVEATNFLAAGSLLSSFAGDLDLEEVREADRPLLEVSD